MILRPQFIAVSSSGKNKKYYESKGYTFDGKSALVSIDDLSEGSHAKVKILCDYCLENNKETIIIKIYKNYINELKKFNTIQKDCCKKCRKRKAKESNLINYGKEHTSQLEVVTDKRINTNLYKYGSKSPVGNKDILSKAKITSNNKFGKEYYMQTDEYKDRVKKTNLIKYGAECTFQSNEIKEKIKETMLERYGVENISQIPEIHQESIRKARVTMYKNKSAPSSEPQIFIWSIIGGELNYPVGSCSLDIAFPKEMIYIEYDGGGHNLQVKLGDLKEDEFKLKEMRRNYYLYNNGWKRIRIISNNDQLPNKDKLIKLLQISKRILLKRSWIEFNIDNKLIKTSKGQVKYNYGDLLSRNNMVSINNEIN